MATQNKDVRRGARLRDTSKSRTLCKPTKTVVASLIAAAALFCGVATSSAGATTAWTRPPTSWSTATSGPSWWTGTATATGTSSTVTSAVTVSSGTAATTSSGSAAVTDGAAPASLAALPPGYQAYRLVTAKGRVYSAGGAKSYGTLAGKPIPAPIIGITSTPTGGGYWLVASDGAVWAFGDAPSLGSLQGTRLARPIVGMTATPTGNGYWLVASDGGVFAFGNARYLGSMGGVRLARPVVGMAATPTGNGYWLVASDGGIFSFGSAKYYGSEGGVRLASPIIGIDATPTGHGYRLVAADGGIFTKGPAAKFYGSLGGHRRPYPITAMTSMYSDKGYWLTTAQGGVQNFGSAKLFGSTPRLGSKVVGMAAAKGNGDPVTPPYSSGSYGYDVSNYQCGNFPSGAHTIGVVEIDGWGDSATNPCFITEVDWAGPGVNLYMFMIYGTSKTAEPGCSAAPAPTACNFGYITASSDFSTASSIINGRVTVPWWLDIEQGNWSSNKSANASVVMGAVAALHANGVATVGFYFALDGWTKWMGDYNPSGPLFPAWWGGPSPADKCVEARSQAESSGHFIPSGQVTIVQYSDNVHGFDGDYAC